MEKTLVEEEAKVSSLFDPYPAKNGRRGGYSHQKTSLTAGTIAHDDELAADFSHLSKRGGLAREVGEGELNRNKGG